MKNLILMSFFLLLFSCVESKVKNDTIASAAGIVEENDMCICTKEYEPVCGSNGVTYPSGCQAGCDKIKEFTEGPCQK